MGNKYFHIDNDEYWLPIGDSIRDDERLSNHETGPIIGLPEFVPMDEKTTIPFIYFLCAESQTAFEKPIKKYSFLTAVDLETGDLYANSIHTYSAPNPKKKRRAPTSSYIIELDKKDLRELLGLKLEPSTYFVTAFYSNQSSNSLSLRLSKSKESYNSPEELLSLKERVLNTPQRLPNPAIDDTTFVTHKRDGEYSALGEKGIKVNLISNSNFNPILEVSFFLPTGIPNLSSGKVYTGCVPMHLMLMGNDDAQCRIITLNTPSFTPPEKDAPLALKGNFQVDLLKTPHFTPTDQKYSVFIFSDAFISGPIEFEFEGKC